MIQKSPALGVSPLWDVAVSNPMEQNIYFMSLSACGCGSQGQVYGRFQGPLHLLYAFVPLLPCLQLHYDLQHLCPVSVPFLSSYTVPPSHSLLLFVSHVVLELHVGDSMSVMILAWQVTGAGAEPSTTKSY